MQVHNLSGPIRIEGKDGKPAMPGDLLAIEILDLGALEGDEVRILPCSCVVRQMATLYSWRDACLLARLRCLCVCGFRMLQWQASLQVFATSVPVAGQMLGLCLKLQPVLSAVQWGFTGCFDRENGGSFLVGEHSVADVTACHCTRTPCQTM